MKNKNILKKLVLVGITTFLLASSSVIAAKEGHLKVTSKVQKMSVITKDGKKSYQFLPATKVLPGELVQYNSAQGKNTQIMFSVDGGKNYGKAGTLKVRGSDGKLYPAKPSNYTHIKWQYLGSLAPKTKQAVAFRARLL